MRHEAGLEAELQDVRKGIQQWRRTRSKQGPMPEGLWKRAGVLAKQLGVTHVSTSLGVGYATLSRYAGRSARPAGSSTKAGSFVELTGSQVLGEAAARGPVIEFATRDGARLTITLSGMSGLDIPALIGAAARRS